MSGVFIAVEGPDGCGKTTAVNTLVQILQNTGRTVIRTREPGGTPLAERIRELLLSKHDEPMDPLTEVALFAAARRQHLATLVEPELEKGNIVLTDRYYHSSFAYQGFARNQFMAVKSAHRSICKGKMPNYVIYLRADYEVCQARLHARGQALDRFDAETEKFKRDVWNGYEEELMYEGNAHFVVVIDANQDEAGVIDQLTRWVAKTFK